MTASDLVSSRWRTATFGLGLLWLASIGAAVWLGVRMDRYWWETYHRGMESEEAALALSDVLPASGRLVSKDSLLALLRGTDPTLPPQVTDSTITVSGLTLSFAATGQLTSVRFTYAHDSTDHAP